MTCGIYKLNFKGTDKQYIGQSVNIEKRFTQHINNLRSNTASPKLQCAFNMYGEPTMEILVECSIYELDIYEDEAIDIFNSVNNGYNHYATANEAPSYSGHGYGNSKYSKKQILECVTILLSEECFSYAEVSEVTGVSIGTVSNLSRVEGHPWLWEEFPDKKQRMLEILPNRTIKGRMIVSDKLSAKAKGIVYPVIYSPEGEAYYIENAYSFAKSKGLAPNHFQEVLNGHRKTHKGWHL